ncbi:hypothetical protein NMG60_11019753 [Bertholletia excelsa]
MGRSLKSLAISILLLSALILSSLIPTTEPRPIMEVAKYSGPSPGDGHRLEGFRTLEEPMKSGPSPGDGHHHPYPKSQKP